MNLHRYLLLLLVPAVLTIAGCATGSAIVTGNTREPVEPEQVRIYLEPPAAFEVIGLVNASSSAGWTEQESMDYAIKELKNQAAKLGANGVLLESSGEKTRSYVGGYSKAYTYSGSVTAKTLQGRAISVKAQ